MNVVTVLLFARAREIVGEGHMCLSIAPGATVASVRQAMVAACPQLREVLPHCLFSVDRQYAAEDAPVDGNSEVACIPPVSGG
jgi:molybdopterin converting factor small subunit